MAQQHIHRHPKVAREVSPSRFAMPGWFFFVLTVALLLGAFVLRAGILMNESLWRDEVDSIRFAFAPLNELLGNLTRTGFNGPFYELLLRVWLALGGINDFTLRYLSLLGGVALLALTYAFARRILGRHVALVTLWFMTIAPVLAWYSGEGKMYTLQPALLVLALYALRRAVDWGSSAAHGRRINYWWIVFVVAVSLGYYMHLLTPLFLPVAVVFFFAWWPRAKHHWRGGLIALALCSVPYIPLAIWQVPVFIAGQQTGHAFYTLDQIVFALFYNWSAGLSAIWLPGATDELSWAPLVLYLGMIAVALVGTIDVQSKPGVLHPMRALLGLVSWVLLPVVLIYLISTRAPVFEPRYLLWLAPAFYMLAASGVVWVWQRQRWAGLFGCALLSSASLVGLYTQTAIPIRPDMRGAAAYVAQQMQADDQFVFQIPYTRYAFEYYLPHFAPQLPLERALNPVDGVQTLSNLRSRITDGPYTNAGATMQNVNTTFFRLWVGGSRVWFVEAEAGMWDSRSLARTWLDENFLLLGRQTFHDVTVSLYERLENKVFLRHVFLPVCLVPSTSP
jgi:4-amino-4-deoxy-L-arabinose transferase-like glycosyltransferase